MSCIQCGASGKYKCPVCLQPYCSVVCCKKHKETPCTAPPQSTEVSQTPRDITEAYDFPTEDTVLPEKLKLLEKSIELKKCLANPHVREILEVLDKSPHPDKLIQEYMHEPIFTEFVDACLHVVQPQDDSK